jgi:MFS transporter, ACS family, glucarate transporter
MAVERRTHVRFFLAFWLFVLSGVAFLDRTNISIAGLQISAEYGLGNQRLGWIFSAFLIGYAGFQLPAGWLAARFGPRRVLTIGVLWWGVATALTALLPSGIAHAVALLIAIRFALGAGEAVIYPAANQFVARWVPVQERGFINGLIFAYMAHHASRMARSVLVQCSYRDCGGCSMVAGCPRHAGGA